MRISEFQKRIEEIYFARDHARGVDGTFRWFAEEVGELARALGPPRGLSADRIEANLREEFADVLAWLATLASIKGVDLEDAARSKYAGGCPKCGRVPCDC